jgi:cell fate regulator YaaT (PSP1 superfamily)
MPEVVSVRFRNRGKVYYFDPSGLTPEEGDKLVVETSKGQEMGDCVGGVRQVGDSGIVQPLRPVIRIATEADIKQAEENRAKEAEAFDICQQKIESRGLDMKLVDVEYSFDGSKILFFFTSDGRVDFRELVKDLAGIFHTRIQLMQIGVRDGAKMLGGLGICGRPFCCSSFLEEFQPVSIKMAKTQSLSLNPTKISGTCGRLMCCLKYEQDAYEYLIKTLPKTDTQVDTPQGKGTVTEVNLLRRTVKVRLDEGDQTPQAWSADRIGYMIDGEYKAPEPEPEREPDAELPVFEQPARAEEAAGEERRRENRRQSKHGGGRHKNPAPQAETREKEDKQERQPGQDGREQTERRKPSRSSRHRKPGPGASGEKKQTDKSADRPADRGAELRQDVLREVMKDITSAGHAKAQGGDNAGGGKKKNRYRGHGRRGDRPQQGKNRSDGSSAQQQ